MPEPWAADLLAAVGPYRAPEQRGAPAGGTDTWSLAQRAAQRHGLDPSLLAGVLGLREQQQPRRRQQVQRGHRAGAGDAPRARLPRPAHASRVARPGDQRRMVGAHPQERDDPLRLGGQGPGRLPGRDRRAGQHHRGRGRQRHRAGTATSRPCGSASGSTAHPRRPIGQAARSRGQPISCPPQAPPPPQEALRGPPRPLPGSRGPPTCCGLRGAAAAPPEGVRAGADGTVWPVAGQKPGAVTTTPSGRGRRGRRGPPWRCPARTWGPTCGASTGRRSWPR